MSSLLQRGANALFLAVLAVYPYLFLVNLLSPSTLGNGKNTYLTIATLLIVVVFAVRLPSVAKRVGLVVVPLLLLSIGFICLRSLAYGEPPFSLFVSLRFPFAIAFYLGSACVVLSNEHARVVARRIIIGNAIVQAAIGVIHDTFFPHIVAGEYYLSLLGIRDQLYYIGEPGKVRFREAGVLISPNVYAHFIVIGMLVLVFGQFANNARRPFRIWSAGALLLMTFGISLSGSRYPLVLAGLSTAVYLLRAVTWRTGLPIAVVAVGAVVLMTPAFDSLRYRFAIEGSGDRGVKTELAVDLMATSASNLLLGARLVDQDTASRGGVGLSDNSVAVVILSYGVPVALLMVTGLGIVLALTLKVRRHLFMLVYGAGVMVLNNGIYWDLWILYWMAALYAMQPVPATIQALQRRQAATFHLKEAPNAV